MSDEIETYLCEGCGSNVSVASRESHAHYEEVHKPKKEAWGYSPCCYPGWDPKKAWEHIAFKEEIDKRTEEHYQNATTDLGGGKRYV